VDWDLLNTLLGVLVILAIFWYLYCTLRSFLPYGLDVC